jgi:hypothetical protein
MQAGGDGDYKKAFDRVASYFPAEITALYAAGIGFAASESNPSWRVGMEIFIFVVAIVFAGFPLWGEGKDDPPKYRRIQIAIATVAFAAWAYALNTGIVAELHIYHAALAFGILFIVNAVASRYQPMKPAPPVELPPAAQPAADGPHK